MRTCECCQRAGEGPAYSLHCPSCLHCGARLIWKIQRLMIPQDERRARCRAVLQDWLQYGHNEMEIRRLAKLDSLPLEPELSTSLSTGRAKRGA